MHGSQVDPERPLAGERILIVEDEAFIMLDLKSGLEEAGASKVVEARALREALSLASVEDVSAAILDVRLGSDGSGAVANVLHERGIPFLFYSGQPATDPVLAAWPEVRAVSKPAPFRALIGALQSLRRL
jgi:DNA-binding response OmpR family regulator